MVLGGIPYYLKAVRGDLSVAQNIDALCFRENGALRTEFQELFRSLFNNPDRHIEVVLALGKRLSGLSRQEIIASTGLASGRALTVVLDDLEQCGFIRKYRDFTKKGSGFIYQLIDPFTLFYLRQMADADDDEGFRIARLDHPSLRAWSGYAFETVCLLHIDQIKKALGIAGVATAVTAWRSRASSPAAQIDLALDRRDAVINICEEKYSLGPYAIDKAYAANLENKVQAFIHETATKKDVHLTLISPYGAKAGLHTHLIQSQVTMDDLFA